MTINIFVLKGDLNGKIVVVHSFFVWYMWFYKSMWYFVILGVFQMEPFLRSALICMFQLSEVFEQEINSVMQSLGYCCGIKHSFSPQVLCCYGKQLCTIPRESVYYSYQNR